MFLKPLHKCIARVLIALIVAFSEIVRRCLILELRLIVLELISEDDFENILLLAKRTCSGGVPRTELVAPGPDFPPAEDVTASIKHVVKMAMFLAIRPSSA